MMCPHSQVTSPSGGSTFTTSVPINSQIQRPQKVLRVHAKNPILSVIRSADIVVPSISPLARIEYNWQHQQMAYGIWGLESMKNQFNREAQDFAPDSETNTALNDLGWRGGDAQALHNNATTFAQNAGIKGLALGRSKRSGKARDLFWMVLLWCATMPLH